MAKSLLPQDVAQMKEMIMQGYVPQQIAKKFGVAVSTVHYHKGLMKKEGLDVPDVKGKRPITEQQQPGGYQSPTAHYQNPGAGEYQSPTQGGVVQPQQHVQQPMYQHVQPNPAQQKTITINGNVIQLDPTVRSVKVNPDGSFDIIF